MRNHVMVYGAFGGGNNRKPKLPPAPVVTPKMTTASYIIPKSDAPLKLKEILWEITPKCNKNCDYCGSKEVMNQNDCLDAPSILDIAEKITSYGVEEITLTGGEPGLIPSDVLESLICKFKQYEIKVKVVTNGTILKSNLDLNHFDAIGLSINTKEDINNFLENYVVSDNLTMITNFGTHNIWVFDKLSELALGQFKCWQIQLTMGKYQLGADGITYLRGKINELKGKNNYCTVVLADNLQEKHCCQAGLRSCSILYNGDVVACLAERSFNTEMKVYGNLLKQSLQEIWETGFGNIRFGCSRKCCRDFIEYPKEYISVPTIMSPQADVSEECGWEKPEVMLYGVTNPSTIVATYAVAIPNAKDWSANNFDLYGVQ